MHVGAGVKSHRHERCVLEWHIHFEDVIGRSQRHLFFVSHDHCLKHVDHLSDIGSTHATGMPRKDVQIQGRENRVTHTVLLDQEARIAARQWGVPTAPFIHYERHLLLRVVLVHDGRIFINKTVHGQSFFKELRVLAFAETQRFKLVLPPHHGV